MMEKAAADNLVDHWDWNIMRDAIKYRIQNLVKAFLERRPPPSISRPRTELPQTPSGAALEPELPATPLMTDHNNPAMISISPSAIESRPSTQHGLILPPFPPRPRNGKILPREFSVSEANEMMEVVYNMIDEFDDHPPFTIQRVCELVVDPTAHYRQLGTWLRAVERSLLVTSTYDQFVLDTYAVSSANESTAIADSTLKLATTPLFSPIPFLHPELDPITGQPITSSGSTNGVNGIVESAPSPLALGDRRGVGESALSPMALDDRESAVGDIPPSPRLGLVDELDDPSDETNHMADHPQAITATTDLTSPPMRSAASTSPTADRMLVDNAAVVDDEGGDSSNVDLFGGSLFGSTSNTPPNRGTASFIGGSVSLQDRFVRSSTPEPEIGRVLADQDREDTRNSPRSAKTTREDGMVMDDDADGGGDADKENVKT
ncbi:hypothetical protein FRC03_003505 [Tulasnella sp. 419]|nr:hypothetical protein FRC03_003505 [Tulasnella sp. 419]